MDRSNKKGENRRMVKLNKKTLLKIIWTVMLMGAINVANANCVFSLSNLNFGIYQSPYQSTDVLSSSPISITCDSLSQGNTLTVKLYQGQSATFDRYLSNGKDLLHYNLFLDSSRSVVWGDGTNGTSIYTTTIQAQNDITIFSSIYKNQNVSPGNYQDSIVFEMSF